MPSMRASRAISRASDHGRPSGPGAVVGVDVLAQQRDLAHAVVGEAAGLGLHVGDGPRELGAARVGHDAEGAELVAALLHGQERRHAPWRGARSGSGANLSSSGKPVSTMLRRVRPGAGDQIAQLVIALRADDQIDHRRAARDLGALGLGDAAGHRDDRVLAGAAPLRPSPGGCGRGRNRPSRPPSRGCGRC